MIWLEFFVCAGVILAAGAQLARYGDMLAEKTGMGRTWIGLILLFAFSLCFLFSSGGVFIPFTAILLVLLIIIQWFKF